MNEAIYLIGVGTDLDKAAFWQKQAELHQWPYKLVGRERKYEWSSHGTKVKYILDAIENLPSATKYVLISDTYDSFVNTLPDEVISFFEKYDNTVHFGNDLKYYELHKRIYTLFPKRYANKLHNRIVVNHQECYLQGGIIGGNREAIYNFYKETLPYVQGGRREQRSLTMMLDDHPSILNTMNLVGLHQFAHLFTRIYLSNFRSLGFDSSSKQFIVDGNIPWVIHCPGALRPTISSYFWRYFISYGTEKNWRIRPFIRTIRS